MVCSLFNDCLDSSLTIRSVSELMNGSLTKLLENDIQYPIIFKIKTKVMNFFVGVEEFSSHTNTIYVPN